MTNKDFKEGMEVTCELNGIKVWDAKLKKVSDNGGCIHATRNGLTQDGCIGDGIDLERHGVTNLQPKPRTIDDLECGDYVVDKGGYKRKCLGRCGEVYAMSSGGSKEIDNNERIACDGFTAYQLKTAGGTLYQPEEVKETDIDEVTVDRCIKVVEDLDSHGKQSEIMRKELVQALKNLKNKYETKNN